MLLPLASTLFLIRNMSSFESFSLMHAQSRLILLCDPVDCSSPGSSVHGIFQTRILEQVNISSSRGYSQPRDRIHVSCIGRQSNTLPVSHLGSAFSLTKYHFSLIIFKTFAPHPNTHPHTEFDYDVFQSEFLRVYPDWDSLSFLNLSVCLLSNLGKVHIISSKFFFSLVLLLLFWTPMI